jgi:hypothetical protein
MPKSLISPPARRTSRSRSVNTPQPPDDTYSTCDMSATTRTRPPAITLSRVSRNFSALTVSMMPRSESTAILALVPTVVASTEDSAHSRAESPAAGSMPMVAWLRIPRRLDLLAAGPARVGRKGEGTRAHRRWS